MEYDFEENRYFGHATNLDPEYTIENGLRIREDVYGNTNLYSTTLEITKEDLTTEEDMLKNVFSIGIGVFRKYVVIFSCKKEDYDNFFSEVENNAFISPEYVCGFYDEDIEFYPNDNCYIFEDENKKYH